MKQKKAQNSITVNRKAHYDYQLGDELRIKVAKANLEKKQLDFVLAEEVGKKSNKDKNTQISQ